MEGPKCPLRGIIDPRQDDWAGTKNFHLSCAAADLFEFMFPYAPRPAHGMVQAKELRINSKKIEWSVLFPDDAKREAFSCNTVCEEKLTSIRKAIAQRITSPKDCLRLLKITGVDDDSHAFDMASFRLHGCMHCAIKSPISFFPSRSSSPIRLRRPSLPSLPSLRRPPSGRGPATTARMRSSW